MRMHIELLDSQLFLLKFYTFLSKCDSDNKQSTLLSTDIIHFNESYLHYWFDLAVTLSNSMTVVLYCIPSSAKCLLNPHHLIIGIFSFDTQVY